jgi:hypothetical protein
MHIKRFKRNGHYDLIVEKRVRTDYREGSVWHVDVGEGQYAIVDAIDYPRVSTIKWNLGKNGYVHGYNPATGKDILLHRFIMQPPPGKWVDHRLGVKLDHRRSELRSCTPSQSKANTRPNKGKKYKGVRWMHTNKKWGAFICFNGKEIYLGCSDDQRECAILYNRAALMYFGDFARPNVIE